MNTRSNRWLRKFLYGIALAGMILSPGVGKGRSMRAHAQPAAADPIQFFLPLVVRPPASQTLTVKKNGTGSGTVTSSPVGIDCGLTCLAAFDYGTSITLSAVAGADSTFSGWSGSSCSGTDPCVVTMETARSVTASFSLTLYRLRIGISGTGSGTVTSDPAGIDCGSTCSASFAYNTVVTLTALPSSPSTFAGWNGGGCSGTGSCQITMNADQQVVATFVLPTLPCSGIRNCDFESGRNGDWTEHSAFADLYIIYQCSDPLNCTVNDIPPHSGSYLAWLGGADEEIAYIEQKQILLAPSAPYLVYWQWIESEDFCGYNYDYAEVLINGAQVDKYDLCTDTSTVTWVPHHIDLINYAGQSVTLQIRVTTDDSNISNLYIDDISLQ